MTDCLHGPYSLQAAVGTFQITGTIRDRSCQLAWLLYA